MTSFPLLSNFKNFFPRGPYEKTGVPKIFLLFLCCILLSMLNACGKKTRNRDSRSWVNSKGESCLRSVQSRADLVQFLRNIPNEGFGVSFEKCSSTSGGVFLSCDSDVPRFSYYGGASDRLSFLQEITDKINSPRNHHYFLQDHPVHILEVYENGRNGLVKKAELEFNVCVDHCLKCHPTTVHKFGF